MWFCFSNVDRITAVWQAVNPNSWFPEQQIAENPTEETLLLPFRSTENVNKRGFWSSKNARKTENFGYTYAEIQGSTGGQDLQKRFIAKYAWSSRLTTEQIRTQLFHLK